MFSRVTISQKDEKHIGLKFEKRRTRIDAEYNTKLLEKQTELGNRIHGGCGQNELIRIKTEKVMKLAEAWSDIYREVCGNPANEKDVNVIIERVKQIVDSHMKSLISNVENNTTIPANFKQACQEQFIAGGMSIISNIKSDLEICVMENKFTLRKIIGRSFTIKFFKHSIFIYIVAPIIVFLIISNCNKTKSPNVTINNYFESSFFISKKQELTLNLRQKYPFGFVIFSVDDKNIVTLNNLNFAQDFDIDWVNTKIKQLTNNRIEILIPKIFYKPQRVTIQKFTMIIPRKVGYKKVFPISFGSQKFKPIFEVLEDHSKFLILVIGFK